VLADALTPRRALARELLALLTLRRVAVALMSLGLVTCLVPVALVGYGMWQEEQLTQSWDRSANSRPATAVPVPTSSPDVVVAPSAAPTTQAQLQPAVPAAFAIRVPKIGYYAAVREGVSMSVLATGPGHYPTTAMPGGQGLVAIAAHNTFWIPFGQLGPGDIVVLQTRSGTFTYHVTGTRIVNPDDRTVLASGGGPSLVLTTCWPLWAGNLASQRLAIFAQQA
jgi:sortase A